MIKAHLETLATQNNHERRLQSKIEITRILYDIGYQRTDILNLYRFLDAVLALPESLELEYNNTVKQIEETKKVQYITTAERIGRAEGRAEGCAKMLRNLLKLKFKTVPASYSKRISVADTATLLFWSERVLTAKTLKEVFDEK